MKIEIKNYENLKNFSHVFEKGLTQIKGETNSGKSSLIRAIWDFAHNSATEGEISIFADPKEKMFIRVNEDEFERDKKNKRYLVSGIENNKPGREKVIKTIDKTNFQLQQERPFLVGETEGEKYSYIIGEKNDIFIDAITTLNKEYSSLKKIFDIKNKDLDRKDLEIIKLNEKIKETERLGWQETKDFLTEKINKIKKLEEIKRNKKEIKNIIFAKVIDTKPLVLKEKKIKLLRKSKEIVKEIEGIKLKRIVATNKLATKINKIKKLEELIITRRNKEKIVFKTTIDKNAIVEKFKNCIKIKKVINNKKELKEISFKKIINTEELKEKTSKLKKLIKIKENLNSLSEILIKPETDVKILKEKMLKINKLEKVTKELLSNFKKIELTIVEIKKINEKTEKNNLKLKELRKEMKICPLCGTHS